MEHHAGDEHNILDILGAATQAFADSLDRRDGPRTIAVEVEASCVFGVVHISVHDYAGHRGNTVELQRPLTPPLPKVVAAGLT